MQPLILHIVSTYILYNGYDNRGILVLWGDTWCYVELWHLGSSNVNPAYIRTIIYVGKSITLILSFTLHFVLLAPLFEFFVPSFFFAFLLKFLCFFFYHSWLQRNLHALLDEWGPLAVPRPLPTATVPP